MNDFDDSYRAMPVGVIAASFAVTMLVDFMPFPFDGFFWLPELTALMLLLLVYAPSSTCRLWALRFYSA